MQQQQFSMHMHMSHTHSVCFSYFAIDFATLCCMACDEWERDERRRDTVWSVWPNKEACQHTHTHLHFSISYETVCTVGAASSTCIGSAAHRHRKCNSNSKRNRPPAQCLRTHFVMHTKGSKLFRCRCHSKIGWHSISLWPSRSYLLLRLLLQLLLLLLSCNCCYRCSSGWHFDNVCIRQSYFFCLESFSLYENPYRAYSRSECNAELKK